MSIYSSFFTPQTISILLCLHQAIKQQQQIDPKTPIMQYLITKILKITDQTNIQTSNQGFQAEMLSVINDIDFVQRYRMCVTEMDDFNKFYREISNILKTLRSLKSSSNGYNNNYNKLQQGNVIDFLVRRLYIYFEKLDFKEIVQIYENFNAYKQGEPFTMRQNEFMLTKSIQQVKFNLQNYKLDHNPQQINKILDQLAQTDHTEKTSFLKGLYKAEQNKPNESLDQMHRYFDWCLGNLFQEKTQTSPLSNKINHCIVSTAYSALKMGHLEECLQSISEGLRISQNNSDEESINNCIIYLYKIAEQLGKYQQEILLAQHAITHSQSISNIILMAYSCLCYSAFFKKYNCQNSQVTLHKSRTISWTQALNLSKKKVYSTFEGNCKNIYHSFRSLLIPTFLHKLAILIHVPQLKNLLLNRYYNRSELLELEVYKEFEGNNQILDKQIIKAKRYFGMNQKVMLNRSVEKLEQLLQEAKSPQTIIKIKKFLSYLKLQQGVQMNCYRSVEELINICQKYGFVKGHLIDSLNFINKMLIKNELYFDALVKIQQTIKLCEKNTYTQQKVVSFLLKAQALSQIGNLMDSLQIIKNLEEEGSIQKLQNQNLTIFWETKTLIVKKIIEALSTQISLLNEVNEFKAQHFQCLQKLLDCYLKEGNLNKIKKNIQSQQDFVILNPLIIQKKQLLQQKLKNTLTYLEKVQEIYKSIDQNTPNKQEFDEEKVFKKLMKKIEMMVFG